ncbi:MAG TPA: hypothetical protein PKA64_25385, partial [Myxococcota bacterium]|nr:hypothetical protein [Myxococcota bacterium]
AIGAAIGAGAVVVAWLAWRGRADGYDPSGQIHPMLDPTLTAPWLIAAAAWGAWELRGTATFTALVGGIAGSLLLYLGRYDCLSTYASTGLATAPLVAALMACGLARLPVPAVVVALASGVAWSHGWLTVRYPKQQQWDLIQRAVAELPPGATLLYPSDADLPPDLAARGYKADRLDLARYVGDRVRTGGLGEPGPAWILRTTDCQRPILSRGGRRAWVGEERGWRYLPTSVASTGPRYAVDGLTDATPWMMPDCAAALAGAEPVVEIALTPETSGSIYEEVRGADPRIGLYRRR